jgi:hypothetical protein
MIDFTLMKLTGDTINILLKVDICYSEFVTNEDGTQTLYVPLKIALSCCVNQPCYENIISVIKNGTLQLCQLYLFMV